MNKIFLIGNVGQEPTYKEFPQGGAVANLTLATTHRGYTKKDGTKVDDVTYWHNVSVGGGLANVVRQYVHKGDKLSIVGEMTYREYTGKDGVKKTFAEVKCEEMEMLSAKKETAQAAPSQPSARVQAVANALGAEPVQEDGLPF